MNRRVHLHSRRLIAIAVAGVLGVGSLPWAGPGPGAALAQAPPPPATPAPPPAPPAPASGGLTGAVGETQTGLAAYYNHRLHGRRTASGERFDNGALTTAHQTLPFGTRVRVTVVKTGKSVVLRVNDRGPTQANRILDVTRAAGQRLGFIRAGLAEVKLEVVGAAPARRRH